MSDAASVAWTHENCNRSGWISAGEPCPICEREARFSGSPCPRCDGDGYVECWNHDQTDVVITLCPDCGPGPGYHDG
jgi:hypothetical protein